MQWQLPWTVTPKPVTVETMELRRRRYEEYAVYVTDEPTRRAMLRGLGRVSQLLKKEDATGAKSHLEVVKHAYSMARHRNLVLKYRSTFGATTAIVQLLLLCAAMYIGNACVFEAADASSTKFKVFLATIGGGLGGVAIVILGLLGIQIQTSATVHRNVWYVLKPISGCIMGLVTYLALEVAAQTLAGGSSTSANSNPRLFTAFLTGFLGGFFETFANRSLLRAAKLDEPSTPARTPVSQPSAPTPPSRPQ